MPGADRRQAAWVVAEPPAWPWHSLAPLCQRGLIKRGFAARVRG